MIKGVTRPEEVSRLGLGNRLMARLGALLKKKFSISLAVLEAATPGSKLETFLLLPEILQQAPSLTRERLDQFLKSADIDSALALSSDDAGFVVLALQEELESEASWSVPARNELLEQIPAALAGQSAAANAKTSDAVFSDEHLTRTRLKLATSANAAERIEALRVLVYSPLNAADKAAALLQGLADADALVRAEAALLLPALGVSADVSNALADLNRNDPARRRSAADKLDKLAATSSGGAHEAGEIEAGAVIVCAMSALKDIGERELKIRLLELLSRRAATLGRNPERLAQALATATSLISTAAKHGTSSRELDELMGPAGRLVKQLARQFPDSMRKLLLTERERAPDFVTEAFVLTALFELIPMGVAEEDALLNVSAAYVARDTDEGRESRAVGALLSRRGTPALSKLCAVFTSANEGSRKHILILLDEMCRKPDASEADLALAATVILDAMEQGSKALRMAAMECRLVIDARVPNEARAKLAEAFLDSTGDFSFPFDVEKAESAVARMGAPAVGALLRRLDAGRALNERVRAARLLGELALNARTEPGQLRELQEQLTLALRRLEAVSLEADFPERGEVLSALGKIVASPAAGVDAGAVVTRTILDAARSSDAAIASGALEGLAYLASARRAQPELIAEAVKLLEQTVDAPEPAQLESQSRNANGEIAYEIEGGESYAVALPAALRGLARIALSPNASAGLARDIGGRLLKRWKEICSGERIWGPLNGQLVVQGLRAIALSERCNEELRVELIKGLFARQTQAAAMHALTDIFSAFNTPRLAVMALAFGYAMLARRDAEGRFDAVDRPEILKALARLAALKALAAPPSETERTPDAFKRAVVNELIKAAKDGVPGIETALSELKTSAALPSDAAEQLARWSARFGLQKPS